MNRVVITGNFDGLHVGHAMLLANLKKLAVKHDLEPLVISFSPRAGRPGDIPPLLTTDLEKKEILKNKFGLELSILKFNDALRQMSPESFINDVIIGQYHAQYWIIGYDHHFGYRGQGSYDTHTEYCKKKGLRLLRGEEYFYDGEDKVNSSIIRKLLQQGDVARVEKYLDRPYCLHGKVIPGDKIGTEIGYPTINLKFPDGKLIPADGVYAGTVEIGASNYAVVINIGIRPTISGQEQRFEAHILDFSEKIYGQNVKIKLNLRIREELKFTSLEDLQRQIGLDIKQARKSLEFFK